MTTPAPTPPLPLAGSRVRSLGWWVEVVAVAHLTVGAVLFRDVLAELVRAGVVGSVEVRGERGTAFWFLLASPAWWAVGRELRAAEERGDRAGQRRTGRAVAGIGAVGALLLPASPFWVLLGLGLAAVRRGAEPSPRPVSGRAAPAARRRPSPAPPRP